MLQSEILSVSERTRTMARRLIAGTDLWLPVPASYQDLTVVLIPPPLRGRFGFSLSDMQKRQIRHAVALTRRLYPLLPARLRYVGPFQEADETPCRKTCSGLCHAHVQSFLDWSGRAGGRALRVSRKVRPSSGFTPGPCLLLAC
jgi:hypothetical protein